MIEKNLTEIKSKIPNNVTLVAVSKTKPVEDIQEAYKAGQRIFGENRIQEMVDKYNVLPKDIEWHMIGHLQTNKVKYMAHFVDLIHGVDKYSKLKEINKQAKKHNRIIRCLLQVKIAEEDSKFGLSYKEVEEIINSKELNELENISISGLMGMASFTDNKDQLNNEFSLLNQLFEKLKKTCSSLEILSMGMSGDYDIAIENGSNMIRVGSSIFGSRNYN